MDLRNFSDYFFEHLASGNSPGILPISSACNAQCVFCSNHTNPFEIMRTKHRPLEEIEKVLWSMSPNFTGDFILNEAITGKLSEGEVFTHPKAFEILECIRSKYKDNKIVISTNGSLLTKDKIDRLSELKPIKVPFSIHSFNRENWKYIFKLKDKHYDTAIESFDHMKKAGIAVAPRVIAMPSLVGYDDLENTFAELVKRRFGFIGVTHASWTKYTSPKVVSESMIDRHELGEFCDNMAEKYDVEISYHEHPNKPMKFNIEKYERITRNHADKKKLYWLTSTAAYEKITPILKDIGNKVGVENITIEVKNESYGGNITCAGLWAIKDVDAAIKRHNLKNEHLIVRGRFLNVYGYDLFGDNIVDYLKTAENEFTFIHA